MALNPYSNVQILQHSIFVLVPRIRPFEEPVSEFFNNV